jgi:hypothetical protein
MVAPAQSTNIFSPPLCSCLSTTSSFERQRWYSSQKRLSCAAAHDSRYVAAGFMLRNHLNAMTDARNGDVDAT